MDKNCQNVGEWLTDAPWRDRRVSLLLIEPLGGARQADDLDGKRAILAEPGLLYALWTGRWRTEVRTIDEEDRALIADLLG